MGHGSPLQLPYLFLLLMLFSMDSQASQIPPTPTSVAAATHQDTTADTSLAIKPKSRTDSVIVVKHSFEHREQIITGSVVMTCLMLMMVAMNNYNPR